MGELRQRSTCCDQLIVADCRSRTTGDRSCWRHEDRKRFVGFVLPRRRHRGEDPEEACEPERHDPWIFFERPSERLRSNIDARHDLESGRVEHHRLPGSERAEHLAVHGCLELLEARHAGPVSWDLEWRGRSGQVATQRLEPPKVDRQRQRQQLSSGHRRPVGRSSPQIVPLRPCRPTREAGEVARHLLLDLDVAPAVETLKELLKITALEQRGDHLSHRAGCSDPAAR